MDSDSFWSSSDSDDDDNGLDNMGLFGQLLMLSLFQKLNLHHELNTPTSTKEIAKIKKFHNFVSACQNGELGIVKKLLSKDKELVNQKVQTFGQTGLYIAAGRGHRKIVLYLLKNGANLELADNDGDNPIHYAAAGNQVLIIEDLIKAGILLNAPNKEGKTPLHVAATQDHLDCVKMLLKYKANINVQDNDGDTPLRYAILKSNDEIVELLLNAPGIDLKIRSKNQQTVLITAAIAQNEQLTRRILEKTPELVNEKDVKGNAALHFCCAVSGDKVETLKVLVEHGRAEIDIRDNLMRTPLHLTAVKGFAKRMEYLIKCGAKVSTQDLYGDTPLHDAITEYNNTVIDLLIRAPEIDLTIQNKKDFNAFHFAIMSENSYAFEKLLQKAPHLVNSQKKTDGCTCLHLTCLNNRYQLMRALIEKGQANTEITTFLGKFTPLHFAVRQGYCGIIEFLVAHQANVNAQDINGCTPLHVLLVSAAKNNTKLKDLRHSPKIASIWNYLLTVGWKSEDKDLPYAAVCCLLVSAGADCDTKKDSLGRTVLDLLNLVSSKSRRFKNILRLYATDPKLKISFDSVAEPAETGNGIGSAASSDNEVKVNEATHGECLACSEVAVLIQFEPCEHRVVCEPCSFRLKRCFDCKTPIQRKVNGDGKEVAEMNANCCSICTVKKKNVIFLCGHAACEDCSDALTNCHLCRCPIERKVRIC